jgi:hypothetical protein
VFEPPAGELRLDEELVGETERDERPEAEMEDELQLVEEIVVEVVEELDVEPLARYRPAPTPTTNRMTIIAAGITNLLPLLSVLPDMS